MWEPARKRALQERDALQELITRQGQNFRLAPWDWRYYAEKLRQEKYAFDAQQLQPYFQLSNLIEAAFFTAEKLFGLSFQERRDMPKISSAPPANPYSNLDSADILSFLLGSMRSINLSSPEGSYSLYFPSKRISTRLRSAAIR